MFLDQAQIEVKAGDGGNGIVAFRRETGVPHGGPSGGDGGKGGDVLVEADPQLTTLLDFRYRRHYKAERGQHGSGSNRTGRSGEDLVVRVPPGTVLRDAATGEILGELIDPEDRMVVARGGGGGRGNAQFATPTNRAPRRCEPGREGEERILDLELKLIADVGLVGEPNAGKSTFLAAVSRATPKVADYPFTTLAPNLGVVEAGPERSFVIADIPGIIEGAHEGKGLGLQFLRHIERTRTLALMIPADALDPDATYRTLREELDKHAPELSRKPHCVVFTKADLLPPDWEEPRIEAPDAWGQFVVSSVAQRGIQPFLDGLWEMLSRRPERMADTAADEAWEP